MKFALKAPRIKAPRLPRPRIPDFSAAYRRTGKGWIHRWVTTRDFSARAVAWVENDIAKHVVINSRDDIITTRQIRHSAMQAKYPDGTHCFYPSDTASVRRIWTFGVPVGIAYFFLMTWLMLVIGYNISLGMPFSYFFWAIPIVAPISLLALPLGSWVGYRAAPKPLWIHRIDGGGKLRPLIYEDEAFVGSFTPAYIQSLSSASDYREFGEGEKVGGTNILRAGAFIAGIVGVCLILWLALSNDTSTTDFPMRELTQEEIRAVAEEDWQ